MDELKALNPYFYRYRWRLALGTVFVVLANVMAVYAPQIVRQAVDAVIMYSDYSYYFDVEPLRTAFVDGLGFFLLGFSLIVLMVALARGLFMFLMRQTLIVMSRLIEYDQKNELYAHAQRMDLEFYKTHSTGDLMSRLTEDVSRVRMYTGPALMYSLNLLVLFVLVVVAMLQVDVRLTMYTLLPLPVLGFGIFRLSRIIERKSEKIQLQLGRLTTWAQEGYAGIRVIQGFGRQALLADRFAQEAEAYRRHTLSLARTEAWYHPLIMLLAGLSTLLTVVIGGWHVRNGTVTAGNIAEFVIYVNMLTWPITSVGWVMALVQRAAASQWRINQFLRQQPTLRADGSVRLLLKGTLTMHQVSFTYPHSGVQALSGVSLHIEAGQRVALMGLTGSGKTTLLHLLVRLYEPQQGTILLDGIPLDRFALTHLRQQIGFVPQDVILFSDTIYNNIAFSPAGAYTDDQVREAARQAGLLPDILRMPRQFQTVIGERGLTLSGGQKQRLALARTLIKQPRLLLLDDCLSAVDAETEAYLLEQLHHYAAGKTTLVVTHRIFTAVSFDRIFVLHQGKLVEEGTHDSLWERQGIYAMLFRKQQLEHRSGAPHL
ncbi:MAG: ABC transporter ATP-binding protein/permease [Chitinophagales bacterium]|nr:ABC transporter ATP-binding protein/permease [Chitinophagales bacterium]MDW8427907.1 ABC transporter ATP-binding protein [Chitinophagales bacterium]